MDREKIGLSGAQRVNNCDSKRKITTRNNHVEVLSFDQDNQHHDRPGCAFNAEQQTNSRNHRMLSGKS